MSYNKSIKRALDIIDLYTSGNIKLSVTEVAEKLHTTKSTVTRIMSTLESTNLVTRAENDRKYRLGKKIMELANVFILNADLFSIVEPYLKELKEKTGESIVVDIIENEQRCCIAAIESNNTLRCVVEVGNHRPLHAGSGGKLLLSSLSDSKIDKIIEMTGLPKYTATTITDVEDLKKEIKNIRKMSISVSNGEHQDYCFGISAPIRDYSGQIIAALTIAGITMRIQNQKLEEFKLLIKDTANKVSRDLGYWNIGTTRA